MFIKLSCNLQEGLGALCSKRLINSDIWLSDYNHWRSSGDYVRIQPFAEH